MNYRNEHTSYGFYALEGQLNDLTALLKCLGLDFVTVVSGVGKRKLVLATTFSHTIDKLVIAVRSSRPLDISEMDVFTEPVVSHVIDTKEVTYFISTGGDCEGAVAALQGYFPNGMMHFKLIGDPCHAHGAPSNCKLISEEDAAERLHEIVLEKMNEGGPNYYYKQPNGKHFYARDCDFTVAVDMENFIITANYDENPMNKDFVLMENDQWVKPISESELPYGVGSVLTMDANEGAKAVAEVGNIADGVVTFSYVNRNFAENAHTFVEGMPYHAALVSGSFMNTCTVVEKNSLTEKVSKNGLRSICGPADKVMKAEINARYAVGVDIANQHDGPCKVFFGEAGDVAVVEKDNHGTIKVNGKPEVKLCAEAQELVDQSHKINSIQDIGVSGNDVKYVIEQKIADVKRLFRKEMKELDKMVSRL